MTSGMKDEMSHLTDEDLIAYRYAFGENRAAAEAHLDACAACRASFETLQRTLTAAGSAPVPERGDAYGAEVWRRVQPQLAAPPGRWPGLPWGAWIAPRPMVLAGAMAVLLVAAFLAGRFTRSPGTPASPSITASNTAQARDRILLVAVGDHLERSQMVLVELVNAKPGAALDISAEQQRAGDLVAANRLYRQTAERVGETGVASVLDDLERVLVEIANSPSKVSSPQLAELRKRIESRGILFKIRVVATEVREREKTAQPLTGARKTS